MIDLENGLQFDEVLQIAKAVNVAKLLDPQLRSELLNGTNSMLAILSSLQAMPWLIGLIPGNIGGHLQGAVRALQLTKGLLEA